MITFPGNNLPQDSQTWASKIQNEINRLDTRRIPGPQGYTGLSAYQQAQLEGFTGTEEEWLDSLKATPPVDVAFTVLGGTTGTQPTFTGAPLFTGSYIKTGAMVHFTIDVDMDNITNFGTGQYYMELPFESKKNYQFAAGCLHDISTNTDYPIFGHVFAGSKQMLLKSIDSHANSAFNVPFTSTTPFTLATADNFHISGTYISAV
jgi:hypothetical protein